MKGRALFRVAVAALFVCLAVGASAARQNDDHSRVEVSAADVAPHVEAFRDQLPSPLREEGATESAVGTWLANHRRSLRERLDRGDEDSIVNLWLFGTTFTSQSPARSVRGPFESERDIAALELVRLDDFLNAIVSRQDERFEFVRAFLARRGLDPATARGRSEVRALLTGALTRAREEFARTDAALRVAQRSHNPTAQLESNSTIFQDRGLSSDTSLLIDFALDRTLEMLSTGRAVAPKSVRRVAIVGPGLDFINKADGHDFYPQQVIQPLALIDSLVRLGVAADDFEVVAMDVSDRVVRHLAGARDRARAGGDYRVHLPLPRGESWASPLRNYWQHVGDRIGSPAKASGVADADVRAVSVRAEIARKVTPVQMDVVSERLAFRDGEGFDLIIATNVLVYYSRFEQALAVANIARMLRPGGLLLSNTDVPATAPMSSTVGHLAVRYSDRQSDSVFVYQRL